VAALTLIALAILPWAIDRDAARDKEAPVARLRFDRSTVLLLVVIFLLMFAAEVSFVVFGAWPGSFRFPGSRRRCHCGAAELAGEGASFSFTDCLGLAGASPSSSSA
jgi:hypothetical protein